MQGNVLAGELFLKMAMAFKREVRMKVVRGNVLGFCFGVSNTVNLALECLRVAERKGLPCYSIGNLIHNKDVVDYFNGKGLCVVKDPKDAPAGVALIRAHGIPDAQKRAFRDAGYELLDSTCPTVLKGANAIRTAAYHGKGIIVLGFAGHAETIGLQGVEVEDGILAKTHLITSVDDARRFVQSNALNDDDSVFVVTQTTFPRDEYENIASILKARFKDIGFGNVPCPACKRRMDDAVATAQRCGAAVVVGGVDSANTKNLAKEVQKAGRPVFFVENAAGLDEDMASRIAQYESVALLSGSSTPMWVIEEVEAKLKEI